MASMQSIAEIVLHPAPGEEFLLNIIVADEMFNHRPATLKLKVWMTNKKSVHCTGVDEILCL